MISLKMFNLSLYFFSSSSLLILTENDQWGIYYGNRTAGIIITQMNTRILESIGAEKINVYMLILNVDYNILDKRFKNQS